jgi:hypothetical protein
MPGKPIATIALPLLAALAVVTPSGAGPPERPSGRMMFDEVADGLRQYRKEQDEEKRIAWLRRLAPSHDPRVAVELWELFAWVRGGKRTAAIRQVARDCLAEHYATREGGPLSGVKQSDEERGPAVCSWWSRNGADVRRRARELPQ